MFDWSAPAGPGVFSGDFWLGRGAEGVVNWAFWFENPWVNFCLLGPDARHGAEQSASLK